MQQAVYCWRKSNKSREELARDCCLDANSACNPPCFLALARFLLLALSAVLLVCLVSVESGCCTAVRAVGGVESIAAAILDEALGRTGSFRDGFTVRRRQRRHL